jgi:hypothetical protein
VQIDYIVIMTKLLEQALDAVRVLSANEQEEVRAVWAKHGL